MVTHSPRIAAPLDRRLVLSRARLISADKASEEASS